MMSKEEAWPQMKYNFDDKHIGLAGESSLKTRELKRPVGIMAEEWYRFASQVIRLLNDSPKEELAVDKVVEALKKEIAEMEEKLKRMKEQAEQMERFRPRLGEICEFSPDGEEWFLGRYAGRDPDSDKPWKTEGGTSYRYMIEVPGLLHLKKNVSGARPRGETVLVKRWDGNWEVGRAGDLFWGDEGGIAMYVVLSDR